MLKKFRIWESEVVASEGKEALIDKIRKAFGEKLYVVRDFKEMEREGEPKQDVTICSLQSGHSFSLNFAGSSIYSVDFWLPDSTKPVGTLYVSDSGLSTEEFLKALPLLVKEPETSEVSEKFKPVKAKTAKVKTPKPQEDIVDDPGAKLVQAGIDKAVKASETQEYEYGDKETIFEDFKRYVRMVIKGVQPAFLCTGQPGIGKTFLSKQEIKNANLSEDEWIKITGKTTPAALYMSLYKNNGKLIVYDDCDGFFENDDAVNTLKGALDSDPDNRTITWGVGRPIKDTDTGETVPTSFLFTGRVIFLSNKSQKSLKKLGAIKSRSFTLELALSPSDMVAYVEEMLPVIAPDKPMALKKVAMNTIKSTAKKNPTVQLNMRTLLKSIVILEEIDDMEVARRMIVQQCSY